MRDPVQDALTAIAGRFSDDAPSVDEAVLRARYSAYGAWPADARLGLGVLGWVLGPGFNVRGFKEAVNALEPDFATAASVVSLGDNPTAAAITDIVRRAFLNAAVVIDCDLNPDLLYSPLDLSSCTI